MPYMEMLLLWMSFTFIYTVHPCNWWSGEAHSMVFFKVGYPGQEPKLVELKNTCCFYSECIPFLTSKLEIGPDPTRPEQTFDPQ